MTIENELREFIAERARRPASELTDELPLIEQRVLDSLGLYRLIGFIERRFGLTVADEDLVPDNFATIAAIAALVRAGLAQQQPDAATGPTGPREGAGHQ